MGLRYAAHAGLRPAIGVREDGSTTYLESIQVVNGEYSAPLIFVRDEAEALGLAGPPVPHEVEVYNLAVPAAGTAHASGVSRLITQGCMPSERAQTARHEHRSLYALRHDCDQIALREIEREPADVDVRRVLVLGVPGLVAHQAAGDLHLIPALRRLDVVHDRAVGGDQPKKTAAAVADKAPATENLFVSNTDARPHMI